MFDLTGKVAVITGSSRGIGRAIAIDMAKAGAKVVVSSRKAEACEEVAEVIRADGGEVMVVPCNISDRAQLENLVEETEKAWGKVDILVCNAAANPYYGPLAKIPDESYAKTMGNNVQSNLWLCQMTMPKMAERGDGSVIIVSSIAGIRGSAMLGAYGISKAADLGLVMNLSSEFGPKNVRINAILPGVIKTDFAKALWDNPEIHKATVEATTLKRIGDPEDISGVAVFLASDAAKYMTGTSLVVDGGMTTTAKM